MNYFGIGFLTVQAAAELIVRNKNQDPDEPLHASKVNAVIKKIVAALKNKEIEAVITRRLAKGIDVKRTWISGRDFSNWCEDRSIDINPEFDRFMKAEKKDLGEVKSCP